MNHLTTPRRPTLVTYHVTTIGGRAWARNAGLIRRDVSVKSRRVAIEDFPDQSCRRHEDRRR